MTIPDVTWPEVLIVVTGIGGFVKIQMQRSQDRKDKIAQRLQDREDATLARQQQREDLAARRKEEAEAREQASQERRDATKEIIEKAEAEAKATRITAEAVADKLRIEASAIAQRLADQTKRDYVLSTAAIEEKIAGIEKTAGEAFQRQDEKLEIVHESTKEAIEVANHSNQKIIETNTNIQRLQEVLVGQQDAAKTKLLVDGGKLDKLQRTADTIDGKVDAIGGHDGDPSNGKPAEGKLDKLQETADTIDAKVDTIVQKTD